jgi:hypothetical protein
MLEPADKALLAEKSDSLSLSSAKYALSRLGSLDFIPDSVVIGRE